MSHMTWWCILISCWCGLTLCQVQHESWWDFHFDMYLPVWKWSFCIYTATDCTCVNCLIFIVLKIKSYSYIKSLGICTCKWIIYKWKLWSWLFSSFMVYLKINVITLVLTLSKYCKNGYSCSNKWPI